MHESPSTVRPMGSEGNWWGSLVGAGLDFSGARPHHVVASVVVW
ncbi:hypothetical protein [Streptomyces sp. NPDC007172]